MPDYHATKHLVMMSGGLLSWAAAKRVVERHGPEGVVLLFADVKGDSTNPYDGEEESTYAFLDAAATNVGVPLIRIHKGRSVWQHFFARRMMANSRVPICSIELKRELLDQWQEANTDPAVVTLHFGLDWNEEHRVVAMRGLKKGWRIEALMCEPPYLSKEQVLAWAIQEGLPIPKLYALGFPHNNCGGFCVKAGQAQFALMLRVDPKRYAYHEANEERFRAFVGKDGSIMKDRRGGTTKPLTMRQLRERIEAKQAYDVHEWGGCGCAVE